MNTFLLALLAIAAFVFCCLWDSGPSAPQADGAEPQGWGNLAR